MPCIVLLFLLTALREPLSDHHAQMLTTCGRFRLWRDHAAPLRRATSYGLADLFCYVARFAVVQIKISRHLHRQCE